MKLKSNLKKSNAVSLIYLFGLLLASAELISHFLGKSLCTTGGCRIVESFVKGGDLVLLIIGVVLFGSLLFISLSKHRILNNIHLLILISAMCVEGYLVGFQLFIIHEICVFCLTVFTLITIATLIKFIQGDKELIFAFVAFVSVFFVTYLVNPQIGNFPASQYVLVYSKSCPNCEEVIQFCKQYKLPVTPVEVSHLSGTFKALNINSVPVLFCDEGMRKHLILGKENIKDYLIAKLPTKHTNEEGLCPIFEQGKCK